MNLCSMSPSNYYSYRNQSPYYNTDLYTCHSGEFVYNFLVQSIISVLHLIDSLGGLLLISAVSKHLLLLKLETFHFWSTLFPNMKKWRVRKTSFKNNLFYIFFILKVGKCNHEYDFYVVLLDGFWLMRITADIFRSFFLCEKLVR